MNVILKALQDKSARRISKVMQGICYGAVGLLTLMLALSFCGRLQYDLHCYDGNYPHAIYAEESHEFSSRFLTVSSEDHVYVTSGGHDIALTTYMVMVGFYALTIIPSIFAYWFLGHVFRNVSHGQIFMEKNARYLLYYSVIQITVAVIVPFLKLFLVHLANGFLPDTISMSTGTNLVNQLVPAIGIWVAAYIIHYGVNLQDEVDHTL